MWQDKGQQKLRYKRDIKETKIGLTATLTKYILNESELKCTDWT